MPIPNRKAGEDRNEFISRCIKQISNEYPKSQASAICYAQLHDSFSDEMNGGYSKKENTEKYNPSQSNNQ